MLLLRVCIILVYTRNIYVMFMAVMFLRVLRVSPPATHFLPNETGGLNILPTARFIADLFWLVCVLVVGAV